MKKLYVCLLAFLGICISCYDDKGNYDYQVLNQTEVTGIDSIYYCALLSQLKISPQINSADASREYSYLWLCYQDTKDGIDTLSQEKDLAYELTMDPAIYSLVFSYQDTQTGVTKYVSSKLVVESEYSRGWYVMKEKDGNTDLDFFSSTFEAEDLMLKISGEAAQGKPKCFGLIDSYNWLNEETGELEQWNKCFAILAEQDLKIVRVSDLKTLGDFNSLFYEPMDICKPGKWFGWDGANAFINNGKVFTVNTRLGVLGSAKFAYAKEGDYHLVDVVTKKSQLSPLLFDEKSYRFCTVTEGNGDLIYLESDAESKFPEAYPNMLPVYAGLLDEGGLWDPGKGYVVMENANKDRTILHFDLICLDATGWGGDDALKNRIIEVDEVASNLHLAKAEVFGMNRTSKMLYFSEGDKLYYYDLENKRENEVKRMDGSVAIPNGEHIVLIKHVVFNCTYPEEAVEEYTSKLAVATSDGMDYKVYLFDIVSDKVQGDPIIYSGSGIPSDVVYMSSYMSNAYWCY